MEGSAKSSRLGRALRAVPDLLVVRRTYLPAARRWVVPVIELAVIALWVLFLGREYRVMDSRVIPTGREFLSSIQTHHLWNDLKACGACALWNGYQRGGYPAFADPHGSMLHPIVVVTTLLWGVINGSKVALLASLWIAGFAQWWTARILKLSWLPRMWSALLIVAGGHLAGRMEIGVFGVVLSTAAASLVFPAILGLALGRGRRYAALVGLAGSSALLAGQGYMQLGLLVASPALLVLSLDNSLRPRPTWKHLALGGLSALLIAGPFLVPLARFYPSFAKPIDSTFSSAQPLAYLPMNLVISDPEFFRSETLGKFPFPYLYTLYVGWTAVLLAVLGVVLSRERHRVVISDLLATIGTLFVAASGAALRPAAEFVPIMAGARNPSLLAGLSVPLIVALAAFGLDRLLDRPWPGIQLRHPNWPELSAKALSLFWIVIVPLILNLRSAYEFSQHWIRADRLDEGIYATIEAPETEGLQWVQPPSGEHLYVEAAIAQGLKLSPGLMTWHWKDLDPPTPFLQASRNGPPPGAREQVDQSTGVPVYRIDARPYGYVDHGGDITACRATGRGGHLSVTCSVDREGELVVQENMWPGWNAWVDGSSVGLTDEVRLRVRAPAGDHTFIFRYRPWDVPVGLGLAALGLGLAGYLWFAPTSSGPAEDRGEDND